MAGSIAYCVPRNDAGPFSAVEVHSPNQVEELLEPFADRALATTIDSQGQMHVIYCWVPTEIIWDVIIKHGGWVSGVLPPLKIGDLYES